MTAQCMYLYGVAPAGGSENLDVPGIDDAQVVAISSGGLAAIASPVGASRFDELPAAKALHYLAQHQGVLARALDAGPVIPLKFGTCAACPDRIAGILDSGARDLHRALEAYADKVEVDVAAQWPDLKPVLAELANDPRVEALKARITASGDVSTQQRVRLGQLVKELLDERRAALAAQIADELRRNWPGLLTHPTGDSPVVLSAALAVQRGESQDRVGRLDQVLAELAQRFQGRLGFRRSGALPPYSFATAEVRVLEAGRLDAARQTLQLPPTASFAEIKLAHRRLLGAHHPDRSAAADAAQRVQEITAAYELLEEYAMSFRHTFGGAASDDLAVVKVRSLADLRCPLPSSRGVSRDAGDAGDGDRR